MQNGDIFLEVFQKNEILKNAVAVSGRWKLVRIAVLYLNSVHSRIFFTGAIEPMTQKKMGPSEKNKGH